MSGSMNTLNLIVAIKILISENIKTWYFEKYKNKKSNQQKSQWQYFQILKTKVSSFNLLISLIVFNLTYLKLLYLALDYLKKINRYFLSSIKYVY